MFAPRSRESMMRAAVSLRTDCPIAPDLQPAGTTLSDGQSMLSIRSRVARTRMPSARRNPIQDREMIGPGHGQQGAGMYRW